MPESLSNDVFIAYRPDVGGILAMAIYQQLTAKSVNASYDIEGLRADQFDSIILNQVATRPYFVLVLTPGTLERCREPDDWLRREIEHALATGRVIVPVYTSNFDFADLDRFLPAELGREVGRFHGQELHRVSFKFSVQQLIEEFLLPIAPAAAPPATQPVVDRILDQAASAPTVAEQITTESQTPVQGWSERSVSEGVRCSRGHFNAPSAVYCATCGVSLVVSADQDWFCPDGHFNPMGGGPACVVCGALMAARVLDHDVQFTVYRPAAMRPGTWERLLVFVHRTEFAEGERDPVEEVRRQADQVLGTDASRFRSTSQDAGLALPRGDELSLVPQVDGLRFNPPQRSFRWLRDVHREEFDFITDLPDGAKAHGRLCVYLGSVLIADVPLSIPVSAVAAGSQPGGPQAIDHARRYRRIFASYAHDDAEMVDLVVAYAAVTGDEFMRDVTHLRSGQDWNEALRNLIRQADLFQLFWSWNSMRSPEVKRNTSTPSRSSAPSSYGPSTGKTRFPKHRTCLPKTFGRSSSPCSPGGIE